jgi:hypothetical protein
MALILIGSQNCQIRLHSPHKTKVLTPTHQRCSFVKFESVEIQVSEHEERDRDDGSYPPLMPPVLKADDDPARWLD